MSNDLDTNTLVWANLSLENQENILKDIHIDDLEISDQWRLFIEAKNLPVFTEKLQNDFENSLHPVIKLQVEFAKDFELGYWIIFFGLISAGAHYIKMINNMVWYKLGKRQERLGK